jgi:rhodanese-related sulfurtransferase
MKIHLCGLTLLASLVAGCAAGAGGARSAPALIPLDEALARRDRGEAVFVDVRSAPAFAEGHIPGAVNVPVGEIASRVAELRKIGKLPILYCG